MKKTELAPLSDENGASTEQTFQLKTSPTAQQISAPSALSAANTSENVKSKSPKKLSRSGRNNSLTSESGASALPLSTFDNKLNSSPTASALGIASSGGSSSIGNFQKKISPLKERYVPSNTMPDSFRTYRGRGIAQSSDSDDSNMSCVHSECSSCSGSEFG